MQRVPLADMFDVFGHYWENLFNDNLICSQIHKAFKGKEWLLIGQFRSEFLKYHTSRLILEVKLNNSVDKKSLLSLGEVVEVLWR